jgi:RIO kinase 1
VPKQPPHHLADLDGARPFEEPDYSTWPQAAHGPEPLPGWVITDADALDTELGVLKSGKEADVHLVERRLEVTGRPPRVMLVAAKRYRDNDHRLFHRDASYVEGRRVRRSRETRAMARRTEFGRALLAGQWATAEFTALSRLWSLTRSGDDAGPSALVPYPVQLNGRELMLEFLGDDDGHAAPRLAQTRPGPEELIDQWHQTIQALGTLALEGLAHGDLSAYNVLVHRGRLVLIDLPQIVDVVANPQGPAFLARDVATMARWFLARGLPQTLCDPDRLTADLLADAGLG